MRSAAGRSRRRSACRSRSPSPRDRSRASADPSGSARTGAACRGCHGSERSRSGTKEQPAPAPGCRSPRGRRAARAAPCRRRRAAPSVRRTCRRPRRRPGYPARTRMRTCRSGTCCWTLLRDFFRGMSKRAWQPMDGRAQGSPSNSAVQCSPSNSSAPCQPATSILRPSGDTSSRRDASEQPLGIGCRRASMASTILLPWST